MDLELFEDIVFSIMKTSSRWGALQTRVEGRSGLSAMRDQMHKKLLKRGFEFNVMVVGEAGLGKSTLIDTLFCGKVSRRSCADGVIEALPSTVDIGSISHVIEEDNVRMKLTVVDTPGFGDSINNKDCWSYVLEFIEAQHSMYLDAEIAVDRSPRISDTRVHACLYFIAPTGHGLTQLDVTAMRALQDTVNIIPIIAKADSLTPKELQEFKDKIREDMDAAGILPYPRPRDGDDEQDVLTSAAIREALPFAVVGRNYEQREDGHLRMFRRTRCGTVDVENPSHCDFSSLRDLLLRTHTEDLREVTAHVLYEDYRRRNLVHGADSQV